MNRISVELAFFFVLFLYFIEIWIDRSSGRSAISTLFVGFMIYIFLILMVRVLAVMRVYAMMFLVFLTEIHQLYLISNQNYLLSFTSESMPMISNLLCHFHDFYY